MVEEDRNPDLLPTAVVVFEGTVALDVDPDLDLIGDWVPGARDKLAALSLTHRVVIVSGLAKTDGQVRRMVSLMRAEGIPFDDIWCGVGYPVHAARFDNGAQKL